MQTDSQNFSEALQKSVRLIEKDLVNYNRVIAELEELVLRTLAENGSKEEYEFCRTTIKQVGGRVAFCEICLKEALLMLEKCANEGV